MGLQDRVVVGGLGLIIAALTLTGCVAGITELNKDTPAPDPSVTAPIDAPDDEAPIVEGQTDTEPQPNTETPAAAVVSDEPIVQQAFEASGLTVEEYSAARASIETAAAGRLGAPQEVGAAITDLRNTHRKRIVALIEHTCYDGVTRAWGIAGSLMEISSNACGTGWEGNRADAIQEVNRRAAAQNWTPGEDFILVEASLAAERSNEAAR